MDLGEAARRSGALWAGLDGRAPRVVWHLWHDDAVWLVCGGLEQDLPGAAEARTATVAVAGAQWQADVDVVPPGSAEWDAVTPLLAEKRLNAPDGTDQVQRWARESVVLRLRPQAP